MKEPALLWCGANTVITVGGFIWLYQTNVKLANQVNELTQIVNLLNEANKGQPEIYKKIEEAIGKLDAGIHIVAAQLGQHQEYFNYLNEHNESVVAEIQKSSSDFVPPRKPSKVKKLMKMISTGNLKKGKRNVAVDSDSSDDSSSSSSSSESEEEDPMVILKKKRAAKAKAKAKAKSKDK